MLVRYMVEKRSLMYLMLFFKPGGQTIHSALDLKFGDTVAHDGLSDQKLAQLRFHLSELKVIIIDEVSLLGTDLFYRIHKRLCDVFQSKGPFAYKIVIVVGDLLQVLTKSTFQNCKMK